VFHHDVKGDNVMHSKVTGLVRGIDFDIAVLDYSRSIVPLDERLAPVTVHNPFCPPPETATEDIVLDDGPYNYTGKGEHGHAARPAEWHPPAHS
jgi:hypothetical protein